MNKVIIAKPGAIYKTTLNCDSDELLTKIDKLQALVIAQDKRAAEEFKAVQANINDVGLSIVLVAAIVAACMFAWIYISGVKK